MRAPANNAYCAPCTPALVAGVLVAFSGLLAVARIHATKATPRGAQTRQRQRSRHCPLCAVGIHGIRTLASAPAWRWLTLPLRLLPLWLVALGRLPRWGAGVLAGASHLAPPMGCRWRAGTFPTGANAYQASLWRVPLSKRLSRRQRQSPRYCRGAGQRFTCGSQQAQRASAPRSRPLPLCVETPALPLCRSAG